MKTFLAILVGALVATAGYTFWYGQGFAYLSNDPAACKNCHIMNDQYDGWLKSSHHAVATCNDCHTPHTLVRKYLTKAENGFRHSKGFTLQDFPEPIRIRPHNRQLLNENCQECHHEFVSEVVAAHAADDTRFDCIRCHLSSGHGPAR
jgi:cytochrome c nitrite reductase small subunit